MFVFQSRGKQRKIGWFPANRVELLSRNKASPTNQESIDTPSSSTNSFYLSTHLSHSYGSNLSRLHGSNLSASSSSLGPQASTNYALALYSYTADNTDELTFYKGSVIAILNKDDPDWWKGEVNGETGLVPANYVQELDDLQSSITSTKCKLVYIMWCYGDARYCTHACSHTHTHTYTHTMYQLHYTGKEAVSPAQLSKMTTNEIKRQVKLCVFLLVYWLPHFTVVRKPYLN